MPSWDLKPVVNISVRVWIGIQKILAIPGVLMLAFISAMSLSQVMPARHSLDGFNCIECLKHGERSRVGRTFCLSGFAEDGFHFRQLPDHAILDL